MANITENPGSFSGMFSNVALSTFKTLAAYGIDPKAASVLAVDSVNVIGQDALAKKFAIGNERSKDHSAIVSMALAERAIMNNSMRLVKAVLDTDKVWGKVYLSPMNLTPAFPAAYTKVIEESKERFEKHAPKKQ